MYSRYSRGRKMLNKSKQIIKNESIKNNFHNKYNFINITEKSMRHCMGIGGLFGLSTGYSKSKYDIIPTMIIRTSGESIIYACMGGIIGSVWFISYPLIIYHVIVNLKK
jgi:hypothetical protein